jgi:hypothetical protein
MRLHDFFRYFDVDYEQTITQLAEEMELTDIVDLLKSSQIEENFDEIGLFAFGL